MTQSDHDATLPGHGLDFNRMPGHWLLAQMGKRVLRPGGIELTRRMLENIDIGSQDQVVEFAPGLGVTTREALARNPRSYTGVERDEAAAQHVRGYLHSPAHQCLVGRAEDSGLPNSSATVVYGEAMLTMQTPGHKASIVKEAARLLQAGGRYGIHELSLQPDDLAEERKAEINRALLDAIHVGARPSTPSEWRTLLEEHGFTVEAQATSPMHLLEPKRFIQDEGLSRTIRFVFNVARTPAARRRIIRMRSVFRRYEANLGAISLVGVKN